MCVLEDVGRAETASFAERVARRADAAARAAGVAPEA